ncbi:MAG: deoxyribodipyrimidine photo-lyase [Thermoproteota archaeon]
MIQEERIKNLNHEELHSGEYILYWMQSSVRAECNHTLEFAIRKSNDLNQPLIAFFGITSNYPEANLRHCTFLFEGLKDASERLEERGVPLIARKISPQEGTIALSREASMVIVDRGYTKFLRRWRRSVADAISCPLVQVESDVVVPIEEASDKEEYAARTIRPKIKDVLDRYLVPLKKTELENTYNGEEQKSLDLSNPRELAENLGIDSSVKPVEEFIGGLTQAREHLKSFIETRLDDYDELSNDPSKEYQSNLSPYIHFGHINPLEIALKVDETESPGKESFLEELIIRRELAINYVYYNPDYDSLQGLPDWAKKT